MLKSSALKFSHLQTGVSSILRTERITQLNNNTEYKPQKSQCEQNKHIIDSQTRCAYKKKKDHKLWKIKMKENKQKYCTVMMAGTQKITAQTVKDKLNNYVKGR